MERNITPSALHPIDTEYQRSQLGAALLPNLGLASAHPSYFNNLFNLNDAVNELLPEILRRSVASNYLNLVQTELSPFDQNTSESSLFRGLYARRSSVSLERLVQLQALRDSLQQQYSTQYRMPSFTHENIVNPFTNTPVSPRQMVDSQRQILNPHGAGL
jgi:hypothetical protein